MVILGRIYHNLHAYQNIETLLTAALKLVSYRAIHNLPVLCNVFKEKEIINLCFMLFFTGSFLKITF